MKQQKTLGDVDASLDALAGDTTSTTLVGTLTDKMTMVKDLFAAVDHLELHKAINRAAQKKAELAAAVSAKTARARELSQESLAKGQELANDLVSKARPLANIALAKGTQLANRAMQEPHVANAVAVTKQSAQRVRAVFSATDGEA